MSPTLVLLWLGSGPIAAGAFDATSPGTGREAGRAPWQLAPQQSALSEWAARRGVRLQPPSELAQAGTYDPTVAFSIERELDQAEIAVGAADVMGARARLDEAARLLEEHPELPQAAWLKAQELLLRAATLPSGSPEAAALQSTARSLEPEHARTYTELNSASAPLNSVPLNLGSGSVTASEPMEFTLRGLRPGDALECDGILSTSSAAASVSSSARVKVRSGRHHIRVVRSGVAAWSGWLDFTAGTPDVSIPVPAPAACSAAELAGTTIREDTVVPPVGVSCSHWAVGREIRGGVEIATCEGSRCGPLLSWRRGDGAVLSRPDHPHGKHPLPLWASLTIAGASAAVLSTVTLWQLGAFDSPEPGKTVFVFGGVKPPEPTAR